jgi:flagellar hook protein FlgE
MSLFSALTASVSGLQAQANALSAISDNIANADTTGYKEVDTQFQDMLSSVSPTNYNAGGVGTIVRYLISQQGSLASTTSDTDLAIQGNGFFVVQNASGAPLLTRAGSFTQNPAGTLVNASGFALLGEKVVPGSTSSVINGVDQLVPVTINPVSLVANPSTSGTFVANVDSNSPVVTPTVAVAATATAPAVPGIDLPSANLPTSTFTNKTSVTTFDNLGNPVNLDIYFTNTGPNAVGQDTWEVDVYNAADATKGGFPYTTTTAGVTTPDTPLASESLSFSPVSGDLTGAAPVTTSLNAIPPALPALPVQGSTPIIGAALQNFGNLAVQIPNGQTLNINIGNMSQLAIEFSISNSTINGNAPATFQKVSVSQDGTLSEVYSDGTTVPVYKIPLATVASVDSLTPLAGDAFQANEQSGSIVVGVANAGGFGSINADELESSTVDLATELTNMVVAQNSYTANSKVFQVGSDLLQELSNLIK